MTAPLYYEETLYAQHYAFIGGMDEAGRGPLAGPVVACAVIMPKGLVIEGVNDSKLLKPALRQQLAVKIKESAIAIGIGIVDVETIDRVNILQATYKAMVQAVASLTPQPDAMLIDGRRGPSLPEDIRQVCITGGDALSHSIAAASIIAKVTRDAIMGELHEIYPYYGFNKNKGYGVPAHVAAIRQYGLCPVHRRSFKIKALQ